MKHLLKTIRLFPIAVMMVILAMAGAFDLGQALPINIESVFPPPNSHTASVNTDIIIGIVGVVDPDSINSATIPVQGTFSGRISGSFTTSDNVVFDPKNSFFSGELVKTTLTEAIYIDGTPLDSPFVWQFRTEVLAGSGQFIFSQNLGDEDSMGAALGDLDGDGDLDAIVSNGTSLYRYDPTPTTIWFNQGDGTFVDSGQRIDDPDGEDIALGDLDGDGDLDAVLAVDAYQGTSFFGYDLVLINDGHGYFTYNRLSSSEYNQTYGIDLGDLDGDGDLDVFLAHYYEGTSGHDGSEVYFNLGNGMFVESGQDFYPSNYADYFEDGALGDLDNDGDLDVFLSKFQGPNEVWFNDGTGYFTFGYSLVNGNVANEDVSLGDLNNDGYLDAVVAVGTTTVGTNIYLNNGDGSFSNYQLPVDSYGSRGVALGDIDADGDLDITLAEQTFNKVWFNDGTGHFLVSNIYQTNCHCRDIELGDLNGDGSLDFFIPTNYCVGGINYNKVYLNTDLLAPTITSTSPADQAVGVAVSAPIVVTFSEAMNSSILSFTANPNPGGWRVTWDDTYSIATLDHENFLGETVYAISITAAQDLAGNPLANTPYTWQFTTGDVTAPMILEVSPVVSAADVDLNESIVITFSESINPASFTFSLSPDPGGWVVSWNATNDVITLGHNDFQQYTIYTASVATAADLAGNPLFEAPYVWEFTTKDTWIMVAIDIKPGDTLNSINNDGNGIIPVAILGSATFDVNQIDPATVYLDSQAVRAVGRNGSLKASYEDVNGDGYLDMMVQIEDVDGTYQEGDTVATLTGQTYSGKFIRGSDIIRIVPPEN